MQLTKNFALAEFLISDKAIELGDPNTPDAQQLANLKITAAGFEVVRSVLGDCVIVITSGFRNARINKAVGGVRVSAHTLGFAGDFNVATIPPLACARRLAAAMEAGRLKFDQLILESSRGVVHLSFDPRLRCQVKTQAKAAGTSIVNGLPG